MKQIYSFATLSLALFFLFNGASAQTYSGGTYTAVRSKDWHVPSGVNAWDLNGEPPADCKNCSITINPGVTVTLNTHVTLEQSSILIVGSASSTDAAVLAIGGTNGTDWNSSFNIILLNDGSSPQNSIVLTSSNASIDPTLVTGDFDGIFTTFGVSPVMYFKQVGTGHRAFSGTTIADMRTITPDILTGVKTLSGDGTLPIILSQFDAELNNKEVDLSWTTDQESNSDHFAVERSTDGGAHWDVLGTVAAKGNSSVAVHYSYTDADPASGMNEYRLQSIDRDGKSTYSEVKTVRNGLIGNVSIFPNPAKDYVNVTLGGSNEAKGNLSIRLISQSGQLLMEKKVNNTGGTTVALPVSSYPQGNYLIQVIGQDGTQQISKVFISRQ